MEWKKTGMEQNSKWNLLCQTGSKKPAEKVTKIIRIANLRDIDYVFIHSCHSDRKPGRHDIPCSKDS